MNQILPIENNSIFTAKKIWVHARRKVSDYINNLNLFNSFYLLSINTENVNIQKN